ncbi:IS66 family insertion sequence element accessory protein TnpB [Rubrivivax gelatinosus]|uniref:IS66 family insertion sequence element accessory protein TnpB n=1 Tax=Rubrivivax gelatinosus TaxID=28068 RepID=UPI0002DFF8DC|nr:IS66 family insertion sequence element accessory protein TnpB [Rubrivivax gelatinosus]MBG6082997.1 hypothetical protein [Rubrivivax gelatinosus]
MIRVDAPWLCAQPVDMRAGADRLLASVAAVLGQAHAHAGYLLANARATRIRLVVHDRFGIWCAARRLHAGRFVWKSPTGTPAAALKCEQFDALTPTLLQPLPASARASIKRMRPRLAAQDAALAELDRLHGEVQRKSRDIVLRDAQIQTLRFQLARYKRWRFGARAEARTAGQCRLFEETLVEDEASLQTQLEQLRGQAAADAGVPKPAPRARAARRCPRS